MLFFFFLHLFLFPICSTFDKKKTCAFCPFMQIRFFCAYPSSFILSLCIPILLSLDCFSFHRNFYCLYNQVPKSIHFTRLSCYYSHFFLHPNPTALFPSWRFVGFFFLFSFGIPSSTLVPALTMCYLPTQWSNALRDGQLKCINRAAI